MDNCRVKFISCAALFLFLALAGPVSVRPAEATPHPTRHLLLLHSYHKGMKWVDDITTGFTQTVQDRFPGVEFHVEYMDTKRVVGAEHLENLYRDYRYKAARQKYDLVATADDAALRFALRHQRELFPDTPLVFCGVNNFSPELIAGNQHVTGILEKLSVRETVETALALQPGMKRMYIINDRTDSGKGLRKAISAEIAPLADRLEITWLEDHTVEELAAIVRQLPVDAFVLRSAFFLDKAGQTLPNEQDSFAVIDRYCNAPIYSLWDFYLGLGIVGGKLISGTAQGQAAGQMAIRILNGEKPSAIPVVTESPNRFMFDFPGLERFGISKASLPKGSIVINAPRPFYAIDKTLTWLTVAFTVSVTGILVLLASTIRRRKEMERLLRASRDRLLRQQSSLVKLSKSEIFSGDDLDWTIRFLLEEDARQMDVERVSLWRFTDDQTAICCEDLYEKSPDAHSRGTELQAEWYPAYFAALSTEESIVADDAHRHPQTREFSESYLSPHGISSMLDVPIRLNGRTVGVLCHEHVGPSLVWSIEQHYFAIALSNLISLALEQHQRKKSAEALHRSEVKFRELFNNAGDAIIMHDLQGGILEINQQVCDRFGYRREELLGSEIVRIIYPEYIHLLREQLDLLGESGRAIFETAFIRQDGTAIPIEINSCVIENEAMTVVLSIARDISGRKEVDRLKDEMLSAVNHELRTPLTAILGYTSFMMENRQNVEFFDEYLNAVSVAAGRLNELVTNFLDLQKLKASRHALAVNPVAIPTLIEEARTLFANTSRHHTLVVETAPDLPDLAGDAEQLLRVVTNLVSNAYKYSPDGGTVTIRATRNGDEMIIQVEDQGIGIQPEVRELIFERFFRADNSDRRKIGGTGLGLALVREIVRLHAGRVWVESTIGKGSTFFVALPFSGPPFSG
jgi:two-component system sensor histidine kinase/response regulator